MLSDRKTSSVPAIASKVQSVVCLSTDKAVFPVNAMGMTKSADGKNSSGGSENSGPNGDTIISAVRYGNVMYSRGSAIPLFVRQIKSGMPITITEPNMTRFLMPLRYSVALVHHAFQKRQSGRSVHQEGSGIYDCRLGHRLEGRLFQCPRPPCRGDRLAPCRKLYETWPALRNSAAQRIWATITGSSLTCGI